MSGCAQARLRKKQETWAGRNRGTDCQEAIQERLDRRTHPEPVARVSRIVSRQPPPAQTVTRSGRIGDALWGNCERGSGRGEAGLAHCSHNADNPHYVIFVLGGPSPDGTRNLQRMRQTIPYELRPPGYGLLKRSWSPTRRHRHRTSPSTVINSQVARRSGLEIDHVISSTPGADLTDFTRNDAGHGVAGSLSQA